MKDEKKKRKVPVVVDVNGNIPPSKSKVVLTENDIKLGKYFRTFPQDKESGGAIIMRTVSNLDICSY